MAGNTVDTREKLPFKWYQVAIPVVVGALVIGYMFYEDFDPAILKGLRWDADMVLWLVIAMLALALRHVAYMGRLRMLTEGTLSWKAAFQGITLWEMATLIAPMVVGGTAAGFFVLLKEQLGVGRTTAIVLTIILIDHLLFVLLAPLLWVLVGSEFLIPNGESFLGAGIKLAFWLGWLVFAIYSLILGLGVWGYPEIVEKLLVKAGELPVLKRWREGFRKTAHDIYVTAQELRHKGLAFWLGVFVLTFLGWSLRFLNTNFLVQVVNPELDVTDHVVMYARQVVMWLGMLVMPVPGGAGFAETSFAVLLAEFIPPGMSAVLTLVWRVMGFYVYMLLGVIVLPFWWRRVSRR